MDERLGPIAVTGDSAGIALDAGLIEWVTASRPRLDHRYDSLSSLSPRAYPAKCFAAICSSVPFVRRVVTPRALSIAAMSSAVWRIPPLGSQ